MKRKTESRLARAFRRAKETGVPYMICRMDDFEGTSDVVRPLSYTQYDEFQAFCGEVLAVCYPDGSME